jgi:hypothetical protein
MECRRCISLDIKTTVVTSSDQSKVKDSGIDTSGRKSRKRWPHSLADRGDQAMSKTYMRSYHDHY